MTDRSELWPNLGYTLLILTLFAASLLVSGCTTTPPLQQRVAVDPGIVGSDTISLLNQLTNQQMRQAFLRTYQESDITGLNTSMGNVGASELLSDARGVSQRAGMGELIARSAAEQTRSSTRITEEQTHELSRQMKATGALMAELNARIKALEGR